MQVLGGAAVGSTAEEGEDDQSAPAQTALGGTYQVVGTLADPLNTKPDWVQEIVQVGGCV